MRIPILCALFFISAEFVRVAVAHFQSQSGQALPMPILEGDHAEVLGEPTGLAATASGGAGEESVGSANNGYEGQTSQAEPLDITGAEHETSQGASVEDGEPEALMAALLEEAAAGREKVAEELGSTLVHLISGVATVQGSTRYAIEKVADDIRMILRQLAQFPFEKLHAPMQTVDEPNTPAGEIGTRVVARSGGQEQPRPLHGQEQPPSVERQTTVTELVLVNASDSAGPVQFLIDEFLYELLPGERERVESGRHWRVRFHRGGSFGEADYMLSGGRYEFRVTDFGWQLTDAAGPAEAAAE